MSDIFKYKASLTIQDDRSDEIAKRLPLVFQQRLHHVVARDIQVKSSLVTFHGGASRTATKRHRLVTNWNLLSSISRGTIQIENGYTNFVVSFWLGFPKWALFVPLLFVAIGSYFSPRRLAHSQHRARQAGGKVWGKHQRHSPPVLPLPKLYFLLNTRPSLQARKGAQEKEEVTYDPR